jgi:membrane fusion protein, multidrug efflux system
MNWGGRDVIIAFWEPGKGFETLFNLVRGGQLRRQLSGEGITTPAAIKPLRWRLLRNFTAWTTVIGCAIAQTSWAQGTPVQVENVRKAPLRQTLTLSGALEAPRLTALSARVEGYIVRADFQAGDKVSAGHSVIQLDDEIPRLELSRLQAVLKEADSLMADQQRRVDEAADLIENDNFSRSEYEGLRAEHNARRFRLEQFRTETEIQQARVERHQVRIPYDGVVVEKLVEEGQQVSPSTPLLWLSSMNPLWAEVRLPERYLNQVKPGSSVRIQSAAGGQGWVNSRVSRVVPVSADGSRTFLVRSELANPDWLHAPGMSIRMELTIGQLGEAPVLQVPADAIHRGVNGESVVWVARETGGQILAQPVTVTLGSRAGTAVEISGGELRDGDMVITRGNEILRPGQLVNIVANTSGQESRSGS